VGDELCGVERSSQPVALSDGTITPTWPVRTFKCDREAGHEGQHRGSVVEEDGQSGATSTWDQVVEEPQDDGVVKPDVR